MPPKQRQQEPEPEADYEITEDGRVIFHKTSGGEFAPVPVGDYELIVQSVDQRFGKDSGDPYFAFEFRTSSTDPELDNKAIWENISPKAQWRLTQLHEAVNGKDDAQEDGEVLELNVFDLFGAKVKARLGLETSKLDGKVRNKITRFYPAGDEEPAPSPVRTTTRTPAAAAQPQARKKRV